MASPFLRKNTGGYGIDITIEDGTSATPKSIDLSGVVNDLPSFLGARVMADDEDFLIHGNLIARTEADDASEFTETSMTIYALDTFISTNEYDVKTFLMDKLDPADGTTDLVNLNTGSVTLADLNGKDKVVSITPTRFLFKMKVKFNHADGTSTFGYEFLIYVKSIEFSTPDGKLQTTITFTPYSKLTNLTI